MWQAAQNNWYCSAPLGAAASESSWAIASDSVAPSTRPLSISERSLFMSGHRLLSAHRALVHSLNHVDGGEDRAFHPGAQVTEVLAREVHAAVGLQESVVIRLPGRAGPAGGTAEGPRHPVPAYCEAFAVVLLVVLRVNLTALLERPLDPLLWGHARDVVRDVAAVGVRGEQDALLLEIVVVGVRNLCDLLVGGGYTAVYAVFFLPEPALELQADFGRRGIGDAADSFAELGAEVCGDLAQDRQRDGADAEIAGRFLGRAAGQVLVTHPDTVIALADLRHLRAVTDQVAHFTLERPCDLVHAAHRLEHRQRLVRPLTAESAPGFGTQNLFERLRSAGDARPVSRTHVLVVAAPAAAGVLVIAVQCTPAAESFEQTVPVISGEPLVQCALIGCLGEQFCRVAHEIGCHRHAGDGFTVVDVGAVDERVPVVVDEDLELNAQPLAVIKQSLVAVGNAPRTGVEVLAFGELDVLDGAAKLLEASAVAN